MQLSKKDRLGWLFIFAAFCILLLVGGAAYWSSKKTVLDEQTLCPLSGEKVRYAVLVDKSDKWGRGDVERVKDTLQSIYRDVPVQGRLAIYTITGKGRDSTDIKLVFDVCNPGSEAECNALYSNCRKAKRDYKQAFEMPLRELVKSLKQPGETSFSPILKSVGTMVKDNKGEVLKLHIISDFMENADVFSFYRAVPTAAKMVENYPLPKKAKISAAGYFIQRQMHPLSLQNAVQKAWDSYFQEQNIQMEFTPFFETE